MASFHFPFRAAVLLAAVSSFAIPVGMTGVAMAAPSGRAPALIITDDPLPPELQQNLYSKPVRVPDITMERVLGGDYYEGGETVVGQKVAALRNEFFALQGTIGQLAARLSNLESQGQAQSAEYYTSVATINMQLQSGTTPGNPRLIKRLAIARDSLEGLTGNVAALNDLSMEISNAASRSGFLMESVRATYSLSGAIEEDHAHLARLEDSVNNNVVGIERLQNAVNDDITRIVSYLSTERNNLRTLSLAVSTGDLLGKNLSNRPFSSAQQASFAVDNGAGFTNNPGGRRPLAKIRFDKTNVAYEQPVYNAVSEALQRYPNARFELIAVHPTGGNAAESTIESTRARRNAEKVLRSLTQMGISMDRIDLSYMPSAEAATSEVHLFMR